MKDRQSGAPMFFYNPVYKGIIKEFNYFYDDKNPGDKFMSCNRSFVYREYFLYKTYI